MAIDLLRQRLFVAELGNDSVGIVDLKNHKLIHTIGGLNEPQGVGYVPSMEMLYVANARDGSVRAFLGADYAAAGNIDLGDDADNIRVDTIANQIIVGYGKGGLAVIDAKACRKIADIPLGAHPESFQLDPDSNQIFVNLPYTRALAITENAKGANHLDVAWTLTNLALLYSRQGRYGDAEALHKRALAIREQVLGASHSAVGESLHNLALIYADQRKYGEAEELYKRALGVREQALGSNHPDVGQTLNNLALVYQDQGKYEDAEGLLKRALV